MKPLWQDVEQEASDELAGGERHGAVPRLPVAAVILVSEGDAAFVEADQSTVRDGDAMGVKAKSMVYRRGGAKVYQLVEV